jgi:hypothetical protein
MRKQLTDHHYLTFIKDSKKMATGYNCCTLFGY